MVLRLTLRTEQIIDGRQSLVIHPETGLAYPATSGRAKFVYAGVAESMTFWYKGEKYIVAVFPDDERVEYYEAMKVALDKSGTTTIIEPYNNLPNKDTKSWYGDIDVQTEEEVAELVQKMSGQSPSGSVDVRMLYYIGVRQLHRGHFAYLAGKLPLHDVHKCLDPVVGGCPTVERHFMEGRVCLNGCSPDSAPYTVSFFLEGAENALPDLGVSVINWNPNAPSDILVEFGARVIRQERGFGSMVYHNRSQPFLGAVAYDYTELCTMFDRRN